MSAQAAMSAQDEVRQQDEQYMQAAVQLDIPALANMMDDDYVFIHGSGKGSITNKQDHLASLESGSLKYTSLHLDKITVRMHGDTAILTSYVSVEGTDNDLAIRGQYLATRVYIKQGEQWRIVLAHSTRS
jgi:uncharacterized protein (TIGR02246 family)